MTAPTERIERLRSMELFEGLSDESLSRILEMATEFEAPAGQVLVQPNTAGAGLFILEEGSVMIEMHGGAHEECGPGEFFGELALLTDQARTARVRASAPIKALAINREDFRKILESEPTLAIHMLERLAQRFAKMLTR